MKPKRIYQVYLSRQAAPTFMKNCPVTFEGAQWRWRVIAARNRQIVGGSQESFDSKGNALRAARREVSLYKDGFAVVEVAE
ncbi:hypothetical protein QTI05_22680 [Variovorax sp. J22R193]|uniref:hypothetical protein n=1 Tax=Variovorax fucosicus TaxID=3053517 RepID=UPI002577FDB4|nr:hypothetical protein [Variovorax sp. J22R193]MDM0041864.1 hypothetical protein [Variovorax sp. J22R193]